MMSPEEVVLRLCKSQSFLREHACPAGFTTGGRGLSGRQEECEACGKVCGVCVCAVVCAMEHTFMTKKGKSRARQTSSQSLPQA